MKNLNSKGMTLLEVILSLAVFTILSAALFHGVLLASNMYLSGEETYKVNSRLSKGMEGATPHFPGNVSFKVSGTTVNVPGKYKSKAEDDGEKTVFFHEFVPN